MRIVGWYGNGNNSAVMAKLLLAQNPNDEIRIIRCTVPNEHNDNERFHNDIEKWLGIKIERLASTEYSDCWDVWERRGYISGVHGAPCTIEMKKAVRWQVEKEWQPDFQAFGFSWDEINRMENFKQRNPDIKLLNPLIIAGITKQMCAELVAGAGIEPAYMYQLGFPNNNCIACAKASSIYYWARTRHYFPKEFNRMKILSRRLGCRLTRYKGERIFLDQIPLDID